MLDVKEASGVSVPFQNMPLKGKVLSLVEISAESKITQ